MAVSRLDMFWAEATDVSAATESPTKSARESLFAYLMTQLHLLRRFHAMQYIITGPDRPASRILRPPDTAYAVQAAIFRLAPVPTRGPRC